MLTLEHEISYTFKGLEIKNSFFTEYLHLQNNSTGEMNTPHSIGNTILANNVAGYSGNTGSQTTVPHLHAGMYFTSLKDNPFANWLNMQSMVTRPTYSNNYYTKPSMFY